MVDTGTRTRPLEVEAEATAQDFELDALLTPEQEQGQEQEQAKVAERERARDDMGLDAEKIKPEEKRGDRVAFYAAMGASVVTLLGTWPIVIQQTAASGYSWFTLHPLLQPVAIVLLTYGVMTLQPTSQPKTKAAGLYRHQLAILLLALPVFTFGTLAVVINKSVNSKEHFTTWHGTAGIICLLWFFAQVLLGGGSVWFGGKAFGGGAKAKSVWRYHRISGYALYSLLLFTLYLAGVWSHWAERMVPPFVGFIVYMLSPVVIFSSLLWRTRFSKMKIW